MEKSIPAKGKTGVLAHVRQDESGAFIEHDLADPLKGVSKRAEKFASLFGSADWAYLVGLWHDLVK